MIYFVIWHKTAPVLKERKWKGRSSLWKRRLIWLAKWEKTQLWKSHAPWIDSNFIMSLTFPTCPLSKYASDHKKVRPFLPNLKHKSNAMSLIKEILERWSVPLISIHILYTLWCGWKWKLVPHLEWLRKELSKELLKVGDSGRRGGYKNSI